MSTYGTVVIADLPDSQAAERLVERFREVLSPSWERLREVAPRISNPLDDLDEDIVEVAGGAVRLLIDAPQVVTDGHEAEFFTGQSTGRAVICEDGDEYGVMFSVWRLDPAGHRCLYRAYVQVPDGEPEPVAAARVVGGPDAAAEAAELYGRAPQRLLDLEADPSPIADHIGSIGSPFMPWLEALGLEWPRF